MTYADLANTYGKTAVQIVELQLDFCENTYGVSPCAAALGITGNKKCYNTAATCQDRTHYTTSIRKYRFSSQRIDGIQEVGDPPIFPTLLSVQTAPTVLTPGQGLGIRSSLSISIQDHPWTDIGCDPYRSSRSIDPESQGTFWGKFLARNKYYQNRKIVVYTGFVDGVDGSFDIANFKTRTYIITKISGPNNKGVVTIDAKDPLKLADGEKAQWPQASTITLNGDITDTTTSLTLYDPDLQLSSWFSAGQQYIKLEDEVIRVDSITSGSGTDSPVISVTRGLMPSRYAFELNIAAAHASEATVQLCWLYDNAPVYDIVYQLLHDVAGISSDYLPLAEWTSNINSGFQYLQFTALLTEPVAVKDLLTELTLLGVLIWWDERSSQVKLKGLRFQQLHSAEINDTNAIIAESVSVTEDPNSLTTQVWLYFDLQWPLANMELLRSYRVVGIRANLEREGADEYAASAIKQIKTRWLSRSDAGVAVSVGNTLLKQYEIVRKVISWAMDPKDDEWWTGDTVGVATRQVQDEDGLFSVKNYLITQVEEVFGQSGVMHKYVAVELFNYLRTGNISHPDATGSDPIPAPANYGSASDLEKASWAYICPDGTTALATEAWDPLTTEDDVPIETDALGDGSPHFSDGTVAYQIL